MTIITKLILPQSDRKITFISRGGDGGDGGNGRQGLSNLDQIPPNPVNAKEVYHRGPQVDNKKSCSRHCGEQCKTCDEYWYHTLSITTDACGGHGGKGGDGGNGGSAGILNIFGISNIEIVNARRKSKGGASGSGGAGASGIKCNRHFTGYRLMHESAGCHGFLGLKCDPSLEERFEGYGYTNNDQECPGEPGAFGYPGKDWELN